MQRYNHLCIRAIHIYMDFYVLFPNELLYRFQTLGTTDGFRQEIITAHLKC